jgi:hypothetical protein
MKKTNSNSARVQLKDYTPRIVALGLLAGILLALALT